TGVGTPNCPVERLRSVRPCRGLVMRMITTPISRASEAQTSACLCRDSLQDIGVGSGQDEGHARRRRRKSVLDAPSLFWRGPAAALPPILADGLDEIEQRPLRA